MARKIKFALEMADGAKVRGSIEELREHFDLEKAVGYFLSGKLVEWLEDRFYEDEAEAVEAIDKDAADLRERLCEALGVPYEGDLDLDVEALERLNEKKAILRQKTGDEDIISHAEQTALNQEDLADLLEMDEPVIYLCGEKFNIPARVKNKRYVGILGTPTISIKANSQEELASKGIVFENVTLPWAKEEATAQNVEEQPIPAKDGGSSEKAWKLPKQQLITVFKSAFKQELGTWGISPESVFIEVINQGDTTSFTELTGEKKETALLILGKGKYTEDEIIHLRVSDDLSRGWAFTRDSFCIVDPNEKQGGGAVSAIIPYDQLSRVPVVDEEKRRWWFGTPMAELIEGRYGRVCKVLNEYGILLPDGSATMYFYSMLTSNESYSKREETEAALKKYLETMNNLFQ